MYIDTDSVDGEKLVDTVWQPEYCPQLRALEAFSLKDGDGASIGVRDPGGLSEAVLVLSPAALHVMSLMNGRRTCRDIHAAFFNDVGRALPADAMRSLLDHLESAHFLDGPGFEAYYDAKQSAYRRERLRRSPSPSALDVVDRAGVFFDDVLADAEPARLAGKIIGLVAPHLDYPRGRPCYATAYAALRDRPPPDRVVILGTNHFGRSTSVVATASDFETPLGITRTDVGFLERLEDRCGDLRGFEFDHAREHSVELQVAWLQHMFGADAFRIVPFLCPEPCMPRAADGASQGAACLPEFAGVLRELIAEDSADTLIVAGADLSHIGAAFGDARPLDGDYLGDTRRHDHHALDCLVRGDPHAWVRAVAANGNPTHICSAGCTFALSAALPDVAVHLLAYHQAVDQGTQTCVTCAAVAYTRNADE